MLICDLRSSNKNHTLMAFVEGGWWYRNLTPLGPFSTALVKVKKAQLCFMSNVKLLVAQLLFLQLQFRDVKISISIGFFSFLCPTKYSVKFIIFHNIFDIVIIHIGRGFYRGPMNDLCRQQIYSIDGRIMS